MTVSSSLLLDANNRLIHWQNKRRSKNRRRPTTLSPLPDAADITTAALSTTTLPPPLSMPSTLAGLNIGPLPSPPQSLEGPPPPLSVLTPETSTQRPPDQVHPKRRRGRRRKNRNQRQDKSESNLDGSTEGSSSGLTISEIGSGALQDGPTASRGRRVRNRLWLSIADTNLTSFCYIVWLNSLHTVK